MSQRVLVDLDDVGVLEDLHKLWPDIEKYLFRGVRRVNSHFACVGGVASENDHGKKFQSNKGNHCETNILALWCGGRWT